MSVGAEAPSTVGAQLDPIHLSIFSHRFMSIAGEWRHCPPGPSSLWCQVRGLPAGQTWVQVVRLAGVCRENMSRRGRGRSGVSADGRAGSMAWLWIGTAPCTRAGAFLSAARALGLPVDGTWAQRSEPVSADVGPQVLAGAPDAGVGDAPHTGQTQPGHSLIVSKWATAHFGSWPPALGALKAKGPVSHTRGCAVGAVGAVGPAGAWSLCAPRADGPNPAAHGHLHQHQGAPRLLLRPLWP